MQPWSTFIRMSGPIKKYVFINDYENIIAYSEVRKVSATSGQCCLRRIFLLSLKKI